MVKAYVIAGAVSFLGIILIAVSTLSSLDTIVLLENDFYGFFGIAGSEVPVHDVVRDLGIALVIAGIISVSYESFVHQRLLDEIAKTALEGVVELFRRSAGDKVTSQVETHILRSQVLRTKFTIEAKFTWNDDSRTLLLCRSEMSYTLKNLSTADVIYPLMARVDLNGMGVEGIKRVKTPDQDLTGPELRRALENNTDDPSRQTYKKQLQIKGDRQASVLIEFRTVYQPHDHESWFTNVMADGVKLIVEHPPDLALNVNANHPNSAQITKKQIDDRHSTWELEYGLLPYQGIMAKWNPKDGAVESTSPAAAPAPADAPVA